MAGRLLATFSRFPKASAVHLKNIPAQLDAFHRALNTSYGPEDATPATAPRSNPLQDYFDRHSEGPGIWKWDHYFEIYHRHLAKFVGREAHMAEVGIYSGGSLSMWRSYFGPNMRIHGIDIEEACRVYETDGIEVSIGDQADRAFWAKFRSKAPELDILIDDGGHTPEQQRVTFEEMFPHLRPGGVYICEDIHGCHNAFASYFSGYGNAFNYGLLDAAPGQAANNFQRWCHSIHAYPFLVVIEKNERPRDRLTSSKRGTQWQPFFDRPATPDRPDR